MNFDLQNTAVLQTAILNCDGQFFDKIEPIGTCEMLHIDQRIESFANVPHHLTASAEDLAVNGFYHMNVSMSNSVFF